MALKRASAIWILALGGSGLSSIGASQMLNQSMPASDWEQRLGETVPGNLRLTDSDGSQVRVSDLLHDKPLVLALVYYECPMLCNLVLEGLTDALGELSFQAGTDYEVLVVSIDPGETAEMAASRHELYRQNGALSGDPEAWRFLVGEERELRAIAGAVGFSYSYVPETDEYAHAAGITVLTPEGVVSRVLFGIEFKSRDLKFALMEASEGTIGSPIDKVLLRCFAYDPTHGKYGLAIMTAIRIAGIATILLMGTFLYRALRSERNSEKNAAGKGQDQGALAEASQN